MADNGHLFGGTIADYVVTYGPGGELFLAANAEVWFYNEPTGGTRYTDGLTDLTGTPITSVTSDATGAIPQLRGPEGVTEMWADANQGNGPRRLMVAADLGALEGQIVTLTGQVQTAVDTVSGLATVATTGEYGDLIGKPNLAAVATSGHYSDLIGAPAPGLQVVIKVGGTWPVRASTAPDPARPAMWIGEAPAPPAGGGYALDSDLWIPVP